VDGEQTPGSSSGGKRSPDSGDQAMVAIEEIGERSINKPHKMKCVKIEKDAWLGR